MGFDFSAEVWAYPGDGAWHFVTLPPEVAEAIADRPTERRGFGTRRVSVTVGRSTWRTSLFPDSASRSFLLPIRRSVRDREGISAGDLATIHLALREDVDEP
jgi:hypothetical protein